MIMYHLGPQLGVWIMQASTFSSVLINRFHCIHIACYILRICTYIGCCCMYTELETARIVTASKA